jgi:hypothetical protein
MNGRDDMSAEPGPHFDTPYNVVAAFPGEAAARSAARALGERGVPPAAITVAAPDTDSDEEVAALRAEMQDEVNGTWAQAWVLMTGRQAKGAFWGTLVTAAVFMVVGLIAGAIWAAFFRSALAPWARIVFVALIAGLAGGTIGFIAGGGIEPRHEAGQQPSEQLSDITPVAEREAILAVHSDDRATVESAAAILGSLGADRVAFVDATGTPLPPQKEHPRPADPPGYWWKHAGSG